MPWLRRRITWEATDWAGFFSAGGVLTVDAWERATKESRAACLMAVAFFGSGAEDASGPPGESGRDEPARVPMPIPVTVDVPRPSVEDEIRSIGGRPRGRAAG